MDDAKRSFYCAVNGIFGKVRRLASEEVVVQLLLRRCMAILLYANALEVCALDKRSVQSLDFTIRTSNIVTARECQSLSGVDLPSIIIIIIIFILP